MDEDTKGLIKVFMVVVLVWAAGATGFAVANHTRKDTVDDGDATSERCVQDCATWAKRTTDELRRFCDEPGRKCESLAERTDATKFRPLYRPGNTARHAACGCTDGQARMSSIWNVDEVW
jgi:hypothetical protein